MAICGIYTITNLVNGKMYVGFSRDFAWRKRMHIIYLNLGEHKNSHLQSAWNKYGKENFEFEIIEECEKELLSAMEHYWATILRVHEDEYGYNIKPTHPYGRYSHSKETVVKIQATRRRTAEKRGYWFSEKDKAKMSKSSLGKKMSEEAVEKNRQNQLGKKKSKETRLKMSNVHKKIAQTEMCKSQYKKVSERTSKPIIVKNMKNKIILEYASKKECLEDLNISYTLLAALLSKNGKTYKNMKFTLKNKEVR